MAYCSVTLAGIASDCSHSKGGIAKVYLTNYQDGIFTLDATTGEVSTIKEGVTFYEYDFKKNTCSMTSTLNVDAANGVNYVSTELILQFNKMETAKRIEIAALSTGDLAGIVVDSNGKKYCLGVEEPMTASAGSGQTGQAKGDGNFYQITMADEQDSYPVLLKSDVEIPLAE